MLNVSKYFFALAAVVSITAVGCDDGGGTQAATGGSGGGTQTAMGGSGGGGTTSAPPTGEAIALTPNEMGWVDLTTNTVGIQGAWYPYGDNAGDKKCTATGGHTDAECSVIAKPDPTVMGFPNTGGKMCTEGTTAKVLKTSAGADDYSNMWGAGIGMDFNHPPDPATKMPFDAVAAGIKGVSFDLDMPVVSSLRVEFPIPETEMHADGSAYWGATKSWPASPVSVGTNTITWDKVQQPNGTIPFNPAKLLGIQFHVPTNTSAATPYSFCISNLKLIK